MERQRCPSLPQWDGMLGAGGGRGPALPGLPPAALFPLKGKSDATKRWNPRGLQIVSCSDCAFETRVTEGRALGLRHWVLDGPEPAEASEVYSFLSRVDSYPGWECNLQLKTHSHWNVLRMSPGHQRTQLGVSTPKYRLFLLACEEKLLVCTPLLSVLPDLFPLFSTLQAELCRHIHGVLVPGRRSTEVASGWLGQAREACGSQSLSLQAVHPLSYCSQLCCSQPGILHFSFPSTYP